MFHSLKKNNLVVNCYNIRCYLEPKVLTKKFENSHFTNFNKYSSAVAERPRDALCPSVVSLNKTITRAESFMTVT